MEFWSFICDQLSEVQFEACNLCSFYPPTNPVLTACGHCFCWPCMQQFLQGQAKPCPVCSTMLSSDVNVVPTFDTQGALVLRLPTVDEVEHSWEDNVLDWSDTAVFAPAASHSEEPSARRDRDMPVSVVFDEETTYNQRP